jgi:hypothetical protein
MLSRLMKRSICPWNWPLFILESSFLKYMRLLSKSSRLGMWRISPSSSFTNKAGLDFINLLMTRLFARQKRLSYSMRGLKYSEFLKSVNFSLLFTEDSVNGAIFTMNFPSPLSCFLACSSSFLNESSSSG